MDIIVIISSLLKVVFNHIQLIIIEFKLIIFDYSEIFNNEI